MHLSNLEIEHFEVLFKETVPFLSACIVKTFQFVLHAQKLKMNDKDSEMKSFISLVN